MDKVISISRQVGCLHIVFPANLSRLINRAMIEVSTRHIRESTDSTSVPHVLAVGTRLLPDRQKFSADGKNLWAITRPFLGFVAWGCWFGMFFFSKFFKQSLSQCQLVLYYM